MENAAYRQPGRPEPEIANGEISSPAEQLQAQTGQSVSRYFEEREK